MSGLEGLVEPLAWDSEHFGFAVGKVLAPVDAARLEAAAAAADGAGIRCLTALVGGAETAAVVAAETAGFRCYDVRVELDREVRPEPRGEGVREAEPAEFERLSPIAATSFLDSRFYADPHFPREAVEALYVAWLRRGFSGGERLVLVTEDGEGFIVCDRDERAGVGTVELIAVAAPARGRGHGARLVRQAEAVFAEVGLGTARVVTQGANVAAQRLYQGEGYRTRDTSLWLHRWALS